MPSPQRVGPVGLQSSRQLKPSLCRDSTGSASDSHDGSELNSPRAARSVLRDAIEESAAEARDDSPTGDGSPNVVRPFTSVLAELEMSPEDVEETQRPSTAERMDQWEALAAAEKLAKAQAKRRGSPTPRRIEPRVPRSNP